MKNTDINNLKKNITNISKLTANLEILIVEDHDILLNSLKNFLAPLFKCVDVADSGEEGIKFYKERYMSSKPYDIIFSDIQMPKMNGIELTKKIYKLNPNQKIVIFSAYQESQYMLELINLGIKRFIPKPIEFESFINELEIISSDISDETLENKNILKLNSNTCYCRHTKTLYQNHEEVKLTNYEQLLLSLFISKINSIVTFDEIVNYFYSNLIDIKHENVRKLMYGLRKKVSNELIESMYSIGYRIVIK